MGIGRMLFNEILKTIKGKTVFIEVNASPFSEKIYSKSGFNKIGEIPEKNRSKLMIVNDSNIYK